MLITFSAITSQLRMVKVIFIISTCTGLTEAAVRPVVTFTPLWNKILPGESVTMTCEADGAVQGKVTYSWYKNNQWTHEGKTFTIQSAQSRHGGYYKCRRSEENISEENISAENISEENISEENISEESISEENISEENISEENISEENISENISAENISEENISEESISEENISEENISEENISAENISAENISEENISEESISEESISEENISEENISEENISEENISEENISAENISEENISEESISEENISEENISEENISEENISEENISEENISEENISEENISEENISENISEENISEAVLLNVTKGPVILQSPPFVYEGDDLILRCHSGSKDSQERIVFYKNNEKLPSFANDSEILLRAETAEYKCTRQEGATSTITVYKKYSDKTVISVQELFSTPKINLTQPVTIEDGGTTLTCVTRLSPHRPTTRLHFAFYRDGQEVLAFGLSDKCEVSPTRLENSGNYSCVVRTLDGKVWKKSQDLKVLINHMQRDGLNKYLYPSVIMVLLIISAFLIFRHRQQINKLFPKRLQTRDPEPVHSSGHHVTGEYETIYSNLAGCWIQSDVPADDDVCYAALNLSLKASSPKVTETVLYSAVKVKHDES
ncbi:uncharacterized protein [Phyllobates terribilis]|uniref:uncharacterized protein isoform X2 n=1 Tax=Phyllobates terribilis TaxID=111132 RepID=UPI003CCB0C81